MGKDSNDGGGLELPGISDNSELPDDAEFLGSSNLSGVKAVPNLGEGANDESLDNALNEAVRGFSGISEVKIDDSSPPVPQEKNDDGLTR